MGAAKYICTFDLLYPHQNKISQFASIRSGQGRVNPSVAVVFRNLTNNDAVAMIILTDQIFLMPNDQNREMPLRSTVSYFFTRLQSRLFPREDFFNG